MQYMFIITCGDGCVKRVAQMNGIIQGAASTALFMFSQVMSLSYCCFTFVAVK